MCKMLVIVNPLDTFFSASDNQAAGALKAMKDTEKYIPIIRYYDIVLSKYIGLPTISQPMRDVGYFATQNLIKRLKNYGMSISQIIYYPELILKT